MEVNNYCPLVSIVVITFNSEKYILETLESAKSQNYRNIELIITDDCSTDNTVALCKEWINENKSYFRNVKLIEAMKNTGIPSNCNRGLHATSGEWIKFIAGDDILLDDCISIHIDAARKFHKEKFFVSGVYQLHDNVIDRVLMPPKRFLKKDSDSQRRYFLKYFSYILAPSTFFEREALLSLGGFNERYPGIEDFPLYLKIVKCGYRFQLIESPTVIYRVHRESITRSPNSIFSKSFNKHMEDVVYGSLSDEGMWLWVRHYNMQSQLLQADGKIKLLSWKIRLTDPIYWYKKVCELVFRKQFYIKYTTKKINSISKDELLNITSHN